MADEETRRCENLACLCEVPAAEPTCSAYCASPEGRDVSDVVCECGHAACREQIDRQLHDDGGRESLT